MFTIEDIEEKRRKVQFELDKMKTQEERNILGQFSTPFQLADDVLKHARRLVPINEKIKFLDPAIGTGSFASALFNTFKPGEIEKAYGIEVDGHYGVPSKKLWENTRLKYRIGDFTSIAIPQKESNKYSLIICNPPYVRHHHLKSDQKKQLQYKVEKASNIKLTGLAGLYCYFIGLSHPWMKKNAIAGWLIPSEFMDVNYGDAIKKYLLTEVALIQIHRFDPMDLQFEDALVSSAIVWFRNEKPHQAHQVKFTYGGTLEKPEHEKIIPIEHLINERKWTRFPKLGQRTSSGSICLSDYFNIKRGIATGDNKYFILTQDEVIKKKLPISEFRPILPSPKFLKHTVIYSDKYGNPLNNKLFVLDSKLPLDIIKQKFPSLFSYLMEGVASGVSERYLCKTRKIWYSQEIRLESSFYCTYIGRSDKFDKSPFRFLLNHSKAIVTNSYLILYPKNDLANEIAFNPSLKSSIADELNRISIQNILDEGRVYGGGLHKIEPKELAKVSAVGIKKLLGHF